MLGEVLLALYRLFGALSLCDPLYKIGESDQVMLDRTWAEIEFRREIVRFTRGSQVKHKSIDGVNKNFLSLCVLSNNFFSKSRHFKSCKQLLIIKGIQEFTKTILFHRRFGNVLAR